MVPLCGSQFARYLSWRSAQCRADNSSDCGDWPGGVATAGSVATAGAGKEKDTPAPLRSSHYVRLTTSSQFVCFVCRSSIDKHWDIYVSPPSPSCTCSCVWPPGPASGLRPAAGSGSGEEVRYARDKAHVLLSLSRAIVLIIYKHILCATDCCLRSATTRSVAHHTQTHT